VSDDQGNGYSVDKRMRGVTSAYPLDRIAVVLSVALICPPVFGEADHLAASTNFST
jgi:hypothetical protein